MSNHILKKILSFTVCFALLFSSQAFADTVVIGAAPSATNKSVAQSVANTTFITNQYTGPGLTPSSANTLGTSPIQTGVSVDTSAGQKLANVDTNGVSNSGPTATDITSPASNMAKLAATKTTANVITNGATTMGSTNDHTSDTGPTVSEIAAPTANGVKGYYSNTNAQATTGPGVGAVPGSEGFNNIAGTGNTTSASSIPSYTTNTTKTITTTLPSQGTTTTSTNVTNADLIVYQVNNNITSPKPSVQAPTAVVVNATTRQIYFSKDGFGSYAPASLTNLVTAYILLSYKGLDDRLTASDTACKNLESGASKAGLSAGDQITVRDAIGAMFVKSCCDVANVVAENVAGSIPNFVALMNQTVKNWGCVGTNFVNPTGLNSDGQRTNVYDMAIIMDKCTQNATLKLMMTLSSYQLPATAHRKATTLYSSNTLITKGSSTYYEGIGASRMGYTSKAKYTMASEIDYNGQRLIAVILKANGTQFTDTTKLLNFAKVASIEAGASKSSTVSSGGSSLLNSSSDTPGSWQQDSTGWYFVKSNGQRANNEWIKQNGKMYCVDSTGYMITGWRQFTNGKTYYFDLSTGEFRYNTWVNVATGAYYLQADGTLAKADPGTTKNIVTSVGTYTIDENGKALAKVA